MKSILNNAWIDVLTPKQLLFFEPLIRKYNPLVTTRNYDEVTKLAKTRKIQTTIVGRYGVTNNDKLTASIERTTQLNKIIKKPKLLLSFGSPEACRIAFGRKIMSISFHDTPYSKAIPLSIPMCDAVIIPSIISKENYRYPNVLVYDYDGIDSFVTCMRKPMGVEPKLPKNNIVFRLPEEKAHYVGSDWNPYEMLAKIQKITDHKIVALCRYKDQYEKVKKMKNVFPFMMKYDGLFFLRKTKLFIGGGGTMTAESALLGTPTIAYDMIKENLIVDWLEKKKISYKCDNISELPELIETALKHNKNHATVVRNRMASPFKNLKQIIETLENRYG
jgi:predicted glycosyltransferase